MLLQPYFIGGGSATHSGVTGRKNAIDTYGEYCRHSGASLSGKDPTRIDRVGSYAARYAAKNVVAAGLADECEVQLSYSIGLARLVSIQVETFGTAKISEAEITVLLEKHFDFRLAGIIRQFNLRSLPALIKGGFYKYEWDYLVLNFDEFAKILALTFGLCAFLVILRS